jgi:hypothetical protein
VKVLIGSRLTLLKVGILAAAVVASLSLAQQPNVESASETEIFFSYSDVFPIQAPAIIVNPGGLPRDVYIWASNVKEPTGVSGFNLAVQFDETLHNVTHGFAGDPDGIGDKTWLESGGRQGACVGDLFPEPGRIIGQCSTLTPPPPLGPTGNGLLGHVLVWPGADLASSSQLQLVVQPVCPPSCSGVLGTFLIDTPLDPDDFQHIPLTVLNSAIVYLGCADNSPPPNGDGVIDLPNDILGVILRFQMTSADPNWSPSFDLNSDGLIDLPNDILGTILQFQLPCSQP